MSVVVIVYNDAERLPRAVDSVLGQSLRAVEVIIADDCSTDATPRVAARLAAADPRVRTLRLPRNSGGCSAPRNAGIEAARAPYLMFLDSDDELPYHACKSLLLTAERTGADFVTGEVVRHVDGNGAQRLWYPELFAEPRLVPGIRAAPEYFTDHLSTNKLYRADFIARHDLRFPEGVHYEDQLFSARAFVHARSFAVVPWPVYTWHLAQRSEEEQPSISSSRHLVHNVRDRIAVARMVDAFLAESGNEDLRPAKDAKFLSHDLRLYLGDLPFREASWVAEFAAVVGPYLAELPPASWERLPREQRVCQHLLCAGRLAEAADCARTIGRPRLAPRQVTRSGGRVYWGAGEPEEALDITGWRLDEQTFLTGPLRHELVSLDVTGRTLRLGVRTWDPAGLLDEHVTGELWLAAGGSPLKVPFTPSAGPGEPAAAPATLDLERVPLGLKGFTGRRHPVVVLRRLGLRRTDPLLAPADLPEWRLHLPLHRLTVGAEQRGAGRLQVAWARTGPLALAEDLAPALSPLQARARRVRRRLTGPRLKALTYHELRRLPAERDLVVFEALEGRGYADSPRYIHEELVRRGLPLRAVWVGSGDRSSFPPGVPVVRRGSWAYVRALARARYWVDSHGFPAAYDKPPGTRYLQTWHGQAIKHMGFDLPEIKYGPPERRRQLREMIGRWDTLISPSPEFERTFVRANGYQGELLRCGLPRNDALVRWDEPAQRDRARAARARLQIPPGRRMLLYAPTFRDGARGSGESIRVDLPRLAGELGEEWTIVVRPHYYERFAAPPELAHAVRDGSHGFVDVNDLLLASDALLTDYSSVMFDYACLGRPILLYTDDYERYRGGGRGTYYDLAEIAPGPMLTRTGELVEVLRGRGLDEVRRAYAAKYTEFQDRFTAYEAGHASKTVVDTFFAADCG
ncbi:glycosyltransferase [Streptomyces hoynatensis]|uniref:Glycosyltransferase n=1 Tax=Streptomyces hoynatensis TaxID=1141874 RepID=A0A3A9YUM0_9ACTN|nr:glycosyltransferase [Streptomyces hoynatensis]